MIKKLKNMIRGQFAKNMLMIAGGTAFAQALNALASPVITRIYTPEQYGLLTVYTSLLALFAGSECLRYERGIPVADDDESAINLLVLSLSVLLILTFLLLILVVFTGDFILKSLSSEELFDFRLLIPLGFLMYGIYQVFMMWNFRKKAYKSISKTKISQSIGLNLTKITLGLIGIGSVGLIIGRIIGESAGIITLAKTLLNNNLAIVKEIKINKILYAFKRYKRFPLFQLPSTFLSKATNQLPVLFIASFYGGEVVGLYGLAKGIVNLPMSLIGKSVGDVFYGEAASIGRKNPERLKKLSETIFKKLFLVGLIPLCVLILLAPQLFAFVFGDGWKLAGEYARILAFLSFAQLLFEPVSRVYDIFEKQRELLLITILRITLVAIVFGISHQLSLSDMFTISMFVASMVLVYLITYLYAQKIIKNEISIKNNRK